MYFEISWKCAQMHIALQKSKVVIGDKKKQSYAEGPRIQAETVQCIKDIAAEGIRFCAANLQHYGR